MRGKFGLCTDTNEAGEDLLQWCEANNKALVNSFMKHQNKGTWFTYVWRRWSELDGSIMRKDQRDRKVKKIANIRENSISDHRPKTIRIKTNEKTWRHASRGESVRNVTWEKLKITENKEIIRERVNQEMHTRKDEKKENVTNWDWIANIVKSVAEEVCGLEENNTKPWFSRRENEINQFPQEITY